MPALVGGVVEEEVAGGQRVAKGVGVVEREEEGARQDAADAGEGGADFAGMLVLGEDYLRRFARPVQR